MNIKLKQAQDSDITFLQLLRHATMNDYLEKSGIVTDEKYHLARILYRFDDAKIIYQGGEPVGLFKYYHDQSGWHVVQIQILPQYQGQGIGALLLGNLIALADHNRCSVSLSVLKTNPAKMLYQKLGFIAVGENETEYSMQYVPKCQVIAATPTTI